jgi:hypothetical protein
MDGVLSQAEGRDFFSCKVFVTFKFNENVYSGFEIVQTD